MTCAILGTSLVEAANTTLSGKKLLAKISDAGEKFRLAGFLNMAVR